MKNKIHWLLVSFLLVLSHILYACAPQTASETVALAPTATIDIAVLRSDPSYMARCLELNPKVYQSQVSYRSVYPGKTTGDDLRQLLGEPIRINHLTDVSWEYDGAIVIFDQEVVSSIVVYDDTVLNDSLEEAISNYGCPDAIYALDINEHPYGEFSRLLFVYHNIGLYFTIDKFPADLNDRVDQISFFAPGTLDAFLRKYDSLLVPNASKPLTWDEAVQ
jgi:hypothetical protein